MRDGTGSIEEPVPPASAFPRGAIGGSREAVVWLVLWASLLATSFLAAPVPGVNEPHYLCKAHHFWHPDWCPRDFFLASTNAHFVFYAATGWLTSWLSFGQAAVLWRLVSYGLMARAWQRLSRRWFGSPWQAVAALWLLLALLGLRTLSGEWLVGGIEGKVITYACLGLGLADLWEGRRVWAGLWVGLGIAFHPVVGVWGVLAGLGGWLWSRWRRGTSADVATSPVPKHSRTLGVVAMAAAALPGLVPAVLLLADKAPDQIRYEGTYIQVFYRLKHHLDPMTFSAAGWGLAGVMLLAGAGLSRRREADRKERWWRGIVLASVVIGLAGLAIGYGPRPPAAMPGFSWRMQLMKFYPFRLSDVLVPMGLAVAAVQVPPVRREGLPVKSRFGVYATLAIAGVLWGVGSAYQTDWGRRLAPSPAQQSWREACAWVRENTPADSLWITPTHQSTFKWYAHRAEFVAYKDCPQDAAGIVEWNRRLKFLGAWFQANFSDQLYSTDELAALGRETGCEYLITDRLGPMEASPVYQNRHYRVYELGKR